MNLCKHYACRCARANELAIMGMLLEAIAIHDQEVRCRQPATSAGYQPRPQSGTVQAPPRKP